MGDMNSRNAEICAAVRKYFPELEQGRVVDDKTVPLVEDVDAFFKELARIYHEELRMTHEEMLAFIKKIGCSELFEEITAISSGRRLLQESKRPYYFKATEASLLALGYSPQWVCNEFRTALEVYYNWRIVNL